MVLMRYGRLHMSDWPPMRATRSCIAHKPAGSFPSKSGKRALRSALPLIATTEYLPAPPPTLATTHPPLSGAFASPSLRLLRHEGEDQHQEAVRSLPHRQAEGTALRHLQREPKGEAGRLAEGCGATVPAARGLSNASSDWWHALPEALAARAVAGGSGGGGRAWFVPLPASHILPWHPCTHLQHKQRQGIHTDAAAAAAAEQPGQHAAAAAAVAAAAGGARGWLDSGASVGARLWQQLV
jgi:hypothetical protein